MVYKFVDPCRGVNLWYKGYTNFLGTEEKIMPNKRFNKQVPGFGFKNGGRESMGGPAEKRDIRKVEQTIGSSMSSKREKGRMKAMGGGRMLLEEKTKRLVFIHLIWE